MKYFWKEIFKTFKGLVIPLITAVFIMQCIPFENLTVFLVAAFAFIIIYCASVIALSCNKEEKNLLLGMIGKIKGK